MRAIRVVWKSGDEIIKDETVPFNGTIDMVADSVVVAGFTLSETKLDVEFHFDPPIPTVEVAA